MDKQKICLIAVGIAVAVIFTISIISIAVQNGDNRSIEIIDNGQKDTIDDFEYDYSQYDVLKNIVAKLDTYGGTIISAQDHQYNFTASASVVLKDDLLLITAPGGNSVSIFYIHDIRTISVKM